MIIKKAVIPVCRAFFVLVVLVFSYNLVNAIAHSIATGAARKFRARMASIIPSGEFPKIAYVSKAKIGVNQKITIV